MLDAAHAAPATALAMELSRIGVSPSGNSTLTAMATPMPARATNESADPTVKSRRSSCGRFSSRQAVSTPPSLPGDSLQAEPRGDPSAPEQAVDEQCRQQNEEDRLPQGVIRLRFGDVGPRQRSDR